MVNGVVLWTAIHSFYVTGTLETWSERLEKDISDLLFIKPRKLSFLTIQHLEADPAKHTILLKASGTRVKAILRKVWIALWSLLEDCEILNQLFYI